jgi:hypothetical protein
MSRNLVLGAFMVAVLGSIANGDDKREAATAKPAICNCSAVEKLATTEVCGAADDKHDHPLPAAPKNAGLDKMKSLAGTWVVADKDGKPTDEVASVIKVTAGGSAVQETIFPGQPHEMVSLYTADGPDLAMTHYCVLGNQPRMKGSLAGNKIRFEFAGGGNLDPKKDKHMHGATLTIVDADHIELAGECWENGAPMKEMCGQMKLVRKK